MAKKRSSQLDCVPVLTDHGFVREDLERDNGSISYCRSKDDLCAVVNTDGSWTMWNIADDEITASGNGWVDLLSKIDLIDLYTEQNNGNG